MTAPSGEDAQLIGDWTEPRRNCPRCGAHTLVNPRGDEWCSYTECTWGADIGGTATDTHGDDDG